MELKFCIKTLLEYDEFHLSHAYKSKNTLRQLFTFSKIKLFRLSSSTFSQRKVKLAGKEDNPGRD